MYVTIYLCIQTYSMHHLLTNAQSHIKVWGLRLVLLGELQMKAAMIRFIITK